MYLLPMRKTVLSELFEVNIISMMVEKSTLYQETSVERGNQLLKNMRAFYGNNNKQILCLVNLKVYRLYSFLSPFE